MANNKKLLNKKAIPTPVEKPEIGAETDDYSLERLLDAAEAGDLNMSTIQSFSSASQTREYVYTFIDSMALDDRVSSVLEVYASDATEPNDDGRIVWCESDDVEVSNVTNYIINSINVDKNAHEWMYSLIKYGDMYVRLFRKSDMLDEDEEEEMENDRTLNEDVNVQVYGKDDHYAHYVEMVPNPGEMFDLTRHGKTAMFVKAPANVQSAINQQTPAYAYSSYKMKNTDVTVFGATDFVHATLTNENSLRNPETVTIFDDDESFNNGSNGSEYKVRKGQSLLYNLFKVWRQLSLIEDSLIVSRATRSSLVRMMLVEIGDMPADKVSSYLQRLKQNIEQKAALSLNNGMSEYNNPGPVENTVYLPTHNGQGTITPTTIGGDYDPKQLTDLDYFINKFYGSVGIPKQFFSFTDDGAGFNGGSSLSIISSRYAKNVKKFQKTFCQLVTDIVNYFLIDKGLDNYIGKFTVKMQPPITQEEIDKRENQRNRIGIIGDVMNQVGQLIDDDVTKLDILNKMLSQAMSDTTITDAIQEYIDAKRAIETKGATVIDDESKVDIASEPREPSRGPLGVEPDSIDSSSDEIDIEPAIGEPEPDVDSYLPSADELGVDLVDNA